jgi:hypothetical protein
MLPLEDSFAPVLGMTGDQLRRLMALGVTRLYGIDLTQYILSSNPYDLIARPNKPLVNAVFRIAGTNETYLYIILLMFVTLIFQDSLNIFVNLRSRLSLLARAKLKLGVMLIIN